LRKYPGIKTGYAELLNHYHGDREILTDIYNSILTDFIPGYSDSMNSDMELSEITEAMNKVRSRGKSGWAWFFIFQGAALFTYERIRRWLIGQQV
jgi:hypothetical protein